MWNEWEGTPFSSHCRFILLNSEKLTLMVRLTILILMGHSLSYWVSFFFIICSVGVDLGDVPWMKKLERIMQLLQREPSYHGIMCSDTVVTVSASYCSGGVKWSHGNSTVGWGQPSMNAQTAKAMSGMDIDSGRGSLLPGRPKPDSAEKMMRDPSQWDQQSDVRGLQMFPSTGGFLCPCSQVLASTSCYPSSGLSLSLLLVLPGNVLLISPPFLFT